MENKIIIVSSSSIMLNNVLHMFLLNKYGWFALNIISYGIVTEADDTKNSPRRSETNRLYRPVTYIIFLSTFPRLE